MVHISEYEDEFLKECQRVVVRKRFFYNQGLNTVVISRRILIANLMLEDEEGFLKYIYCRACNWINNQFNRWEKKSQKALTKRGK